MTFQFFTKKKKEKTAVFYSFTKTTLIRVTFVKLQFSAVLKLQFSAVLKLQFSAVLKL